MPPPNAYQFKVALRDIHPPIWRRIQVPGNYSLFDLHVAVQSAMGWSDRHLHVFRFESIGERVVEVGIPDEFTPSRIPGWSVEARTFFREPGARASYEYDFGDGWVHEVLLEEIIPREPKTKYPRCIDGARACPPEDRGGLPGYEELLRILVDARDPEHQETILWLGRPFDPEVFDPASIRFANPKQRLKRWRKV
jgi:hypothetical protein